MGNREKGESRKGGKEAWRIIISRPHPFLPSGFLLSSLLFNILPAVALEILKHHVAEAL